MRNLDVGIILIHCNIYSLWSWTFKTSQMLTFSAFVWKLAEIYSFIITTSLNLFAPQTRPSKRYTKLTLIKENRLLLLWTEFLPIKMGLCNELSKPCKVEVEVRKIKHIQKRVRVGVVIQTIIYRDLKVATS